MGIHAVIIYFALCLPICVMVFMKIICIMIFMQTVASIKKGMFLRFVILEKKYKQKNCPRYFQIRKYAFLNI